MPEQGKVPAPSIARTRRGHDPDEGFCAGRDPRYDGPHGEVAEWLKAAPC